MDPSLTMGNVLFLFYGQLRVPGRPIGFELRNKDNVYYNHSYNGGRRGGGPGWQQTKDFNFVIR